MKRIILSIGLVGCIALTAGAQTGAVAVVAPPTVLPASNAPAALVTSPEQAAQTKFDQGVQCMRDAKYGSAAEAFEQATVARPEFSEAYNNWGIALVQLGKRTGSTEQQVQHYQTAAQRFAKAAELKPKEKITYILWAETLVLIGDLPVEGRVRLSCYQGAMEKCKAAIAVAPEDWEPYNKWAAITSTKLPDFAVDDNARVSLYKEAATLFARAAERARFSGELGPVYANWGSALLRAARSTKDLEQKKTFYREAVDKFERSARAIANAPTTYAMWGSALIELGKLEHMRSTYRLAVDKLNISLALSPKDPGVLYNLAVAHALMNSNIMAVEHLKSCFDLPGGKAYRDRAPLDPDFAGLSKTFSFQELISGNPNRGIPAFNPPLSDSSR